MMKTSLMDIYYTQWRACIGFELKFWLKWVRSRGLEWKDDFEKRLDPHLTADQVITNLIDKKISLPRILDVGSGPLTAFPKRLYDGRKVDLMAVDALANEYNAAIKEINIKPQVNIIKARAEELGRSFDESSFDFIYMRNALDHTYDPFASIEQMLKLIKKKAYIFLAHRKNLGSRENYNGSAIWNISSEKHQFIIWNDSRKVNISRELIGSANISVIDGSDWIDITIQRKESK